MTQLKRHGVPSVRSRCGERSGTKCNCLCSRHESYFCANTVSDKVV